jgi:hypothetical protein
VHHAGDRQQAGGHSQQAQARHHTTALKGRITHEASRGATAVRYRFAHRIIVLALHTKSQLRARFRAIGGGASSRIDHERRFC